MFLLSLMARKRFIQLGRDSICFERADLFFLAKTSGMSLTIKWKAVPVACKYCTKRGSTSSFWIMHYLLCIKLLIEWRVWDCLRRKPGIWLEGKRLLLTGTFLNVFSLTHIFEEPLIYLKWISVILGRGEGLFVIFFSSVSYFSSEPKHPYWPQQLHVRKEMAKILF